MDGIGGSCESGGGGGETVNASVFSTTGNDAIVDWVLVELRSTINPSQVLATRSGLLQRDGDVTGPDGVSSLVVAASAGNYYVAVRHRNHLGIMTGAPVALSGSATNIDLRLPGTSVWGTQGRKDLGDGNQALWGGNVFRDGNVSLLKYTGSGNDRDPILSAIGGNTPNAVVSGYMREDVNLSGQVRYTGTANDRDPILVNVGGTVPTNVRAEQLP